MRGALAAITRSYIGGSSMWFVWRVKEEVRSWVVVTRAVVRLGFPNQEKAVDPFRLSLKRTTQNR